MADDCCFTSILHDGEPRGSIQDIAGVATYVTQKPEGAPQDRAILFLPDVFGIALRNNKLLADRLSETTGFEVFIPDYLNGDAMQEHVPPTFDKGKWKAAHGPSQTRPPLDAVINALKAKGFKRFAGTGYCFGGRYVVDLALDGIVNVAAISHPSGVVPDDLKKLFDRSSVPLLINSCEFDPQFPHEAQATTDDILGSGKYTPGYKRTYWEGCSHGFAVRGDISNPKVKAGMDGAFRATADWFKNYL